MLMEKDTIAGQFERDAAKKYVGYKITTVY